MLEKHPKVRELVDNEWLHLFQLDATERTVFARYQGGWNDSIAAAALYEAAKSGSLPIA